MKDINAIIFDFGGVIFDIDYNLTSKAFKAIGVKHFDEMYSQKNANPLFQHLEEGKITEAEFYAEFRKEAHINLTNDEIRNAWNAMLLRFRKPSLSFIESIRSKYKLYLLSNTNTIHFAAFDKMYKDEIGEGSLYDYFDKIYFSHEIRFRKPGNEAYELVLKENNLSPQQTLFIDDSIQNIYAAKDLGLHTIFLTGELKLEQLSL